MGGVGNQMFQYAMGRNLASLKNTALELDITWFDYFSKTTTPRYYSLPKFNIIENLAPTKKIKKIQKYKKKNGKRHFLHNLFFADESIYIQEKQFNFNENILNVSDGTYLTGYWQSEKYFKNIENIIRKEFVLNDNPSQNYNKYLYDIKKVKSNSVAVHIRRGDYTDKIIKKNIGLCPLNYYHNTIKKISEKVENPFFFIFTDDIKWTKNNLKLKYPTSFISRKSSKYNYKNKDYEELILMSKCKHNIIANSSFSWWGAWLNNNPNKIVIAPKKWFNNLNINTEDLIPKQWIKM